MARTHPPYPPEFRRQMVELVHAGRSPEELVREFEPSAQAIRNWGRPADHVRRWPSVARGQPIKPDERVVERGI